MELSKNLLWVWPAYALTAWTLVTFALAWTLPLNEKVPSFICIHPALMMHNPKDDYLYQRPSLVMGLGSLVVGAVPVVCALVLGFVVAVYLSYRYEALKAKKRK